MTTTDADGVGSFAAPLLHGDGPAAPRAVEVLGGDDYTMLDLSSAAFDLSDRGVTGLPHPGPLDAYVWLDRGIYRPGETVHVMALLRDNAGRPADIPVHVIVKRPNGQVFLDTTPARDRRGVDPLCRSRCRQARRPAPGRSRSRPIRACRRSAAGEFRVDAFVPDRMAVELGPAAGPDRARQALRPADHRALPVRRAGRRADRPGPDAAGDRSRAVPRRWSAIASA